MNVRFFTDNISSLTSEAAVVFVFKNAKKKNNDAKGEFPPVAQNFLSSTQTLLKKVLEKDFFCGVNQYMILYPSGEKFERLILVGLGEVEKFDEEKFSHSVGSTAIMLQEKKIDSFSFALPSLEDKNISLERMVFLTVKAIRLAQYQF